MAPWLGAGRGLPLILPQGRQRLQGPGPPEGRSRQRCVAPWRLEGPARKLRRPSGGDHGDHPGGGGGWSGDVGCAGVLGLPAADRLGGGAAEGALCAVAEVDGDGVFGDVDGDDGVGVGAPEGEFLPGDHDDPGVRGPALRGDWFEAGPGWWAGGAGAA